MFDNDKDKEIIKVSSQKELDAVDAEFDGIIQIRFGTIKNKAIVNKNYKAKIEVREKSVVVAGGSNQVSAYDSCLVMAKGRCRVKTESSKCSVGASDESFVDNWGGGTVVACDKSVIRSWRSSVYAMDESMIELQSGTCDAWDRAYIDASSGGVNAHHNCMIKAHGNAVANVYDRCRVLAQNNSRIKANGRSVVYAHDHSCTEATGQSLVIAGDESNVTLCGSGRVYAGGNARVRRKSYSEGKVILRHNACVIEENTDSSEYCGRNDIEVRNGKGIFYKGVYKNGDRYYCTENGTELWYEAGKTTKHYKARIDLENPWNSIGIDIDNLASVVLHLSDDMKIIEVEAEFDKIWTRYDHIQVSEVRMIREVPLSECGLYGQFVMRENEKANGDGMYAANSYKTI